MNTPQSKTRKILIIDDHRLFADGLQLILKQLAPALSVTTQYKSNRALTNIDTLTEFDLLLIDLQMPGLDGFGLLEALNQRKLSIEVLVISGTESYSDIERAFSLGAMGFVPKSSPGHIILQGINAVLNGQRYLPEGFAGNLNWSGSPRKSAGKEAIATAPGESDSTIRPRQLEVLKLIRDGYPNAQIAGILGISESAVKSHISNLFTALGVRNRTSCVQTAIEKGLI